jgi:hypothetical protein
MSTLIKNKKRPGMVAHDWRQIEGGLSIAYAKKI